MHADPTSSDVMIDGFLMLPSGLVRLANGFTVNAGFEPWLDVGNVGAARDTDRTDVERIDRICFSRKIEKFGDQKRQHSQSFLKIL